MRAAQQEQSAAAGVSHVKEKFEDLNWGPVENYSHDLGIDLFLQIRDWRRFDSAALVGAQVKTGEAKYFTRPEKNLKGEVVGWWYTDDNADHFDDWVRHSMPLLLVLVSDGPNRIAYWVHITVDKIIRTGKGCKILVPKSQLINAENFDALMAVATSRKVSPDLQGSIYRAGPRSVPPGRTLRHALLAPRLIVPRGQHDLRKLEPEEAIALITGGRPGDLETFRRRRAVIEGTVPAAEVNPDLVAASPTSEDWRWRLFHAVEAFASHRNVGPAVDLAEATAASADQPIERRAAAAVVAAVALIDLEQWLHAAEVLTAAGSDLPPVDHGWILVHKARVLLEENDTVAARGAAVEAIRATSSDLDDVTARAVSDAAASVLLATTRIRTPSDSDLDGEPAAAPRMSDTAVNWWRSNEIATALDRSDDITFKTWSRSDDLGTQLSEDSQDRLTGAWLTALFSGHPARASWPLSLRSRHEIQHQELEWRDAASLGLIGPRASRAGHAIGKISEALDALRRSGMASDVKVIARRLWDSGPAEPVREVLIKSLADPWRPSTANAHTTLLTAGGDLLEMPAADTAVRQCLEVLADVPAFRKRARPTFLEWHYLTRALRRVLPAASTKAHDEVLTFGLGQMRDDADPDARGDLQAMITSVNSDVVATHTDEVLPVALAARGSLSAELLRKLKDAGNAAALAELRRRAEDGDVAAAGALRAVAGLGATAAQALIRDSAAACRGIVASAKKGSYSPAQDAARNLAVLNLGYPDRADWDPLLELLFELRVPADAKADAVSILANAPTIPDQLRDRLRQAIAVGGVKAITSAMGLTVAISDLEARVYALAVTIDAVESGEAMATVMAWLRGPTAQRRSAYQVIDALRNRADNPVVQGALVMLTADPEHHIRAAAAVALIRGSDRHAAPEVVHAIRAAAKEHGCAVPLAVAHALHRAPEGSTYRDELRGALLGHMSALVRQAASAAG